MSEAQRQQQADVAGDQFTFQQQEARDLQQLNRLSNQIGALRGAAAQANADATSALTGGIGAAASFLGNFFTHIGGTSQNENKIGKNICVWGVIEM